MWRNATRHLAIAGRSTSRSVSPPATPSSAPYHGFAASHPVHMQIQACLVSMFVVFHARVTALDPYLAV